MSLKICFYPSIVNSENERIDTLENNQCMYSIKAGEICSEFIARYFFKPGLAPESVLDTIVKENYTEQNDKKAREEVLKGIYKVKIDDMLEDSNGNFEFKTYKESKIVREKLLEKYKKMNKELKEEKLNIYAMLALEEQKKNDT